MVVTGRKGSGKTVFTVEELLLGAFYQVFDKIILISPTLENQSIWQRIDMADIEVFESVDDRILNAIMDERAANYKESRMLVIMDDLGEDLRRCNTKLLQKVICNSRHLQASFCFLHQRISQAHPCVRSQTDVFVVFHSSSYLERELLWREVSTLERKDFTRIMNQACQEDYGCLICSQSKGKTVLYDRKGKLLFQ